MSATGRLVEAGREAGILDETGALTGRALSRDIPVQGANGTRVNPADVRATLDALERSKTVKKMPVALWYKGRAYHSHPGWKKYYKEVATDNGDYKPAPVEGGNKVMRWLTNHGYRKLWQGPMKGEDCDFAECWMHVKYAGDGSDPQDFHPKSTAEIREYIAMAVAKRDEDTVEPETEDVPTSQPESNFDHAVDVLANFVGGLATQMILAGYAA